MHNTEKLINYSGLSGYFGSVVPTAVAAALINREPQTLRKWACLENGPIRPLRIHGRLAWRIVDLSALLQGKVISNAMAGGAQ